jgi:UDP-N-acetylglucosamine diphosphorylase/glucosamine-1-phosphate N-acetyltransferase
MPLVVTILAGGEGKRMRSDLPKVIHLFNGKPMLVRIIEEVLSLHPDKIIIVTGQHHRKIINTLQQYMDIFGIQFVEQPIPLGTGNAIAHCLHHYKSGDRVLILNGDMPLLSARVIDDLIKTSSGYDGGIVTSELENPFGYGRILYDESKCVRAIIEESSCTREQREINIINAGIYYFKASILKTYIPMLSNNNFKKEYYLTDIIKDIYEYSTGKKITTYLLKNEENIVIRGVNTPEELKELEDIFSNK